MLIQWIAKILVTINSNTRPREIGLGLAFAFLLGIIPFSLPGAPLFNILWLFLFLLAFFLKLNQAFLFIFLAIFKLLAPLLYPLTSWIGYTILTIPELKPFFTTLINMPLLYFTYFNSTLCMGGLILGLLSFAPLLILTIILVQLYRNHLREKIANSKLIKGFLKLPLIKKLSELFGGAISFYQKIKG